MLKFFTTKQRTIIDNILCDIHDILGLNFQECYNREFLIWKKRNDSDFANVVIDDDGDIMISVFFQNKEKSFRCFFDYEDYDKKIIINALNF